jgi:hypothetical protein
MIRSTLTRAKTSRGPQIDFLNHRNSTESPTKYASTFPRSERRNRWILILLIVSSILLYKAIADMFAGY